MLRATTAVRRGVDAASGSSPKPLVIGAGVPEGVGAGLGLGFRALRLEGFIGFRGSGAQGTSFRVWGFGV